MHSKNSHAPTSGDVRREDLATSPLRRDSEVRTSTVYGDVESVEEQADLVTDISGDDSVDDTVPCQFRPFAAFIHRVGVRMLHRSSMGTYITSETKLVRLMNEIYDSCTDGTLPSSAPSANGEQTMVFSAFVCVYLKSRFGIRALVEQQALELLEGLHAHKARLDVEHFSLFLSGGYHNTALAFFLKARDAAQEAISSTPTLFRPTSAASARRRRNELNSSHRRQRRASKCTAALIWLSKTHIESAALRAFDSKSSDSYLQFVDRVRSFLSSRMTERPMMALLELQEFLSLALHTFNDLQRCLPTHRSGSLSSASTHQAHDGHDTPDEYASPLPLPPAPLPRAFGSTVRETAVNSRQRQEDAETETTRTRASDRPAPVFPLPTHGVFSETHGRMTAGDEVQSRLTSLMARMQQRRL